MHRLKRFLDTSMSFLEAKVTITRHMGLTDLGRRIGLCWFFFCPLLYLVVGFLGPIIDRVQALWAFRAAPG